MIYDIFLTFSFIDGGKCDKKASSGTDERRSRVHQNSLTRHFYPLMLLSLYNQRVELFDTFPLHYGGVYMILISSPTSH